MKKIWLHKFMKILNIFATIIVDGLDSYGMIKSHDFENEEDMAA